MPRGPKRCGMCLLPEHAGLGCYMLPRETSFDEMIGAVGIDAAAMEPFRDAMVVSAINIDG